jgi:L-alanine-DL-glutamate epimerase-like enolase superfamily enzyme
VSLAWTVERVDLDLDRPFTISRGTTETAENVLVRLSDGDHTGVGAAAPARRYGETADTVAAVLPALLDALPDDPHALEAAGDAMDEVVRGNAAAKAAVDVALHDLAAKRLGIPLYRLLGLDPSRAPTSSFTVGLGPLEETREAAAAAVEAGFPVLKVKLGTDPERDVATVDAVRAGAADAGAADDDIRIRVDANEGWTPPEAIRACRALAERDVEFVEQPVPAADHDGLARVRERSPLPIAADESCLDASDVPRAAAAADVAVVKLMKTGGIRGAVRAIHAARAHGMETMLGCMVASNAAIAAGMALSPLVDYADLDGAMLLADGTDPYLGVDAPGGRIDLAGQQRPGTGARERDGGADGDETAPRDDDAAGGGSA